MSTAPQTVYRKDYTPPPFLIEATALNFALDPTQTKVHATLQMRRNPKAFHAEDLVLDGEALTFIQAKLNGTPLSANQYKATPDSLTVFNVPDAFTLETEVEINPAENTTLMGLYKDSGGMLCTQCEAEGFRRITYYLDRPDVLSTFKVRLEGDEKAFPILLSNGNKLEEGKTENGRHYALWHDPFPKPSYLFALVGGKLDCLEDSFTTMSGRKVALKLFTEKHNMHKTAYAMDVLKRSMRWDEEKFGREYDLDIFMIVAVDAFNMGAMENKGLNIFNASAVLASADTATDAQFMRIEKIVAHEYFHNWSGNRVTCRSWFELSLKEGFTVFRDGDFSADMNDPDVKRIQDVVHLRAQQFPEDAGPMAHPIRPDSYQSIDNFYTRTVYDKGAEVIGMYKTILGEENFRKGSDLYFTRHDGEAVTCEDFTKAMEDVSQIDLKTFRHWYSQEGTPTLAVSGQFNPQKNTYTLNFKQHIKAGQKAFHMPITLGLLSEDGQECLLQTDHPNFRPHKNGTNGTFQLTVLEDTLTFKKIPSAPIPSLLRAFSAPVKLTFPYTDQDLMFLMQHDTDGFNRWESGQTLAIRTIQNLMKAHHNGEKETVNPLLVAAYKAILESALTGKTTPALAAEALNLPSQSYLAELQEETDLEALQHAYEYTRSHIASSLEGLFLEVYNTFNTEEQYAPSASQIGQRALKNLALRYLLHAGQRSHAKLAMGQFEKSKNMTDALSALSALVGAPYAEDRTKALEAFYAKWHQDPLVLDNWFALQASSTLPGTLPCTKALCQHEKFSIKRPNTVRAVIGAFSMSGTRNFHSLSGEGYTWFTDKIIELDALNPQVAARLVTPLIGFKRYTSQRQKLMRQELERILGSKTLSKSMREVVTKALA